LTTAYLFDLDGTLYQGNAAIPGARELIAELRRSGVPFRFVTNTTSRPRSALLARLRGYGFLVDEHEIFTALLAGAQVAREHRCRTLLPLVTPAACEDLDGFELVGGPNRLIRSPLPSGPHVDAVLVGDLGELWTFDLVQQAFSAIIKGAP
jgi:ribonucleotide monophosphatase NagD (HAD superfamily)